MSNFTEEIFLEQTPILNIFLFIAAGVEASTGKEPSNAYHRVHWITIAARR